MIIGILGLANSGKSTVSGILQNKYHFISKSFADSLKETLSSIFGWPIELLHGKSIESRQWREQVDKWWAERLGINNLSPRWAMQHIGTEILRDCFNSDIWVASLEKKIYNCNFNIVIDDCRFPNEIAMIKKLHGILIEVHRGEYPVWRKDAIELLNKSNQHDFLKYKNIFENLYPSVHISEWGWANQKVNYVIDNNLDVNNLEQQIHNILKQNNIV
jgi:hypothetical protein